MAERFQRRAFQPQRVSTGQSQVFGSLAERLNEFSQRRQQELSQRTAFAAEQAGRQERAGQIAGDIPEGNTIADQAFRQGAMASHAAAIQTHIKSQIKSFETDNPAESDVFLNRLQGFRDGLMGEVDPQLKPLVENEINGYASEAVNRIQSEFVKRQRQEQKIGLMSSFKEVRDDALAAVRGGSMDRFEERNTLLLQQASAMSDSLLVTPSELEVLESEYKKDVGRQMVLGQYERASQEGLDSAQAYIDRLRANDSDLAKQLPEVSPDVKDALVLDLEKRIKRDIDLIDKVESERTRRLDAFQKANSDDLNVALFNGTASVTELNQARALRAISQSQYEAGVAIIERGEGVDSPDAVFDLNERLTDGENIRDDILLYRQNGQLTNATAADFLNKAKSSEDEITSEPDYKVGMTTLINSLRTKGALSQILDPQEQLRIERARQEYFERAQAGEDPLTVSNELVLRYRKDEAKPSSFGEFRFGSKSDPTTAINQTINMLDSGEIDEETAERELLNIQRYQEALHRESETSRLNEAAIKEAKERVK